MKSKAENWVQYPTIITFLFYLAHVFYLPRLSLFLTSKIPDQYYQWPIRIILELGNNHDIGKWIIVIFCVLVYLLSVFYGKSKIVQFLVILTNLFYTAMSSFPALGINANRSFCFLYFSMAILFFNLGKKYFIDKYKLLIALAVSPYILSGLIKVYDYSKLFTDKMLLNRIIELEYFTHRSSFLIPFLKGHDFPTYPLLPFVILLQISGVFAINSLRFRKFWIPSILLFHLLNFIILDVNFFFSFIILHWSFFNSEKHFKKMENRIFVSTFYFQLILTGETLYKLTALTLSANELAAFRIYSIFYMVIIFAGMFFYEKYFMRMMIFFLLILNTGLFLTYSTPFSLPDYIILIILAFSFAKNPETSLVEVREWLLKGLAFIGGTRAILLTILLLEKLHYIDFFTEKTSSSLSLMVELPVTNQWSSIAFLLISFLEMFYRKVYFTKWALPALIILHLYLACFFYVTSSYYLFWIILITALSNVKSSTTPNKWTIASCER